MYATERSLRIKPNNQTKKLVFGAGTAFVKKSSVKRRFTYREFTLLIGIVMALIVMFTLFRMKTSERTANRPVNFALPQITVVTESLLKEVVAKISLD